MLEEKCRVFLKIITGLSLRQEVFIFLIVKERIKAIYNGTKITSTKMLSANLTPTAISSNTGLKKLAWGLRKLEGETIVFPWELIMSIFTK